MQIGVAKRAINGLPHCGDQCAYWQQDRTTVLCMVDGIGHGECAEIAAATAVDYVADHISQPLADIFAGCNVALKGTRGAAMGIARIEHDTGVLTYAGVGNTRARLVGQETVNLLGDYGIVGGGFRRLIQQARQIRPDDVVILWTDGLPDNIDLSNYTDELRTCVQQLAEKLVQNAAGAWDDSAVLIARIDLHDLRFR